MLSHSNGLYCRNFQYLLTGFGVVDTFFSGEIRSINDENEERGDAGVLR